MEQCVAPLCVAVYRWRILSSRRGAVVVVFRRLRPPSSESVVPAFAPFSLSAAIAPVSRRSRLPFARDRWCACPFPPTQYTLPPATLSHRRTGAAGTTLHMDGLGSVRPPALLPPRRVVRPRYTRSHTRTLTLSGTAPSGQVPTRLTLVGSRRGAAAAQPAYYFT